MGNSLVLELKDQFHRQWETLREAITNTPESQWKEPGRRAPAPARLSYHILSGAEVYARSSPYEHYLAHRRLDKDWQAAGIDELPGKAEAVELTGAIEASVSRWLDDLSDDGLLAPNDGFEWSGARMFGRALYLLRHTQNHLGELNALIKGAGASPGKWR